MVYRAKRLILKEFNKNDFDLFYSVLSNELVMKYTYHDVRRNKSEIIDHFNKVLKNNITEINREAYEFAVYNSENMNFVGLADIEIELKNNFGGCGEIGYLLLPEFWGNGYGTEIAKKLIDIGFNEIKLHRIAASCNSNNIRSENIMKKAGMKKEGEFRKARFKNDNWDDEIKYSILIEEWAKS